MHGCRIGICRHKAPADGKHSRDYVVIEYSGGDILYVPCDQMNLIAKYSGAEEVPRLNTAAGNLRR